MPAIPPGRRIVHNPSAFVCNLRRSGEAGADPVLRGPSLRVRCRPVVLDDDQRLAPARTAPIEAVDIAPPKQVALGRAHRGEPAGPDRPAQPAAVAPDRPR